MSTSEHKRAPSCYDLSDHPPPPLLCHLPTVSKFFLRPEWNLLRGARALWRKHN